MFAEVFIRTTDRTVLSYLMKQSATTSSTCFGTNNLFFDI